MSLEAKNFSGSKNKFYRRRPAMKEAIKWTVNHMPKSDDRQLDVMSLPNVAKARFFHSSFPQ